MKCGQRIALGTSLGASRTSNTLLRNQLACKQQDFGGRMTVCRAALSIHTSMAVSGLQRLTLNPVLGFDGTRSSSEHRKAAHAIQQPAVAMLLPRDGTAPVHGAVRTQALARQASAASCMAAAGGKNTQHTLPALETTLCW